MSNIEVKTRRKIAAVEEALGRDDVSAIRSAWAALKPPINDLLDDLRVPRIQAPEEEWVRGFLVLAEEDLEAAKFLYEKQGRSGAVVCMLLQMSFEKISKAQLARSDRDGFVRHRLSHVTASKLLATLKINPHLQALRRLQACIALRHTAGAGASGSG